MSGVPYLVGSAFFFSVMSLLVKVAGARLPSQEIVVGRAVVTLVLSWVWLRAAGVPLWGTRKKLLVVRGVFGFLALSCFYFSLTRLPIAEATVIQYTNPIFTALAAALVLKERIGAILVVGIAICLAGVVIVTRPGFLFETTAALDPLAVGVALLGAVFSAGAYVSVRKIGHTEHPGVVIFYFSLVAVPASLPLVAPVAVWPRGLEWLVLLGVGVATQIGQIFLTKGLAREPAGRGTTVGYLQIVFASAFGVAFLSEVPDVWTLAGSLLIVAGTFLVVRRRPTPEDATSSGPSAP